MGQYTAFFGMLKFARPLTSFELEQLESVRVGMGRCDLKIDHDHRGLVYRSEKSYYMVEQLNYLIAETRKLIPDFALKGSLYASTDFAPYYWLLKIGDDGFAHQVRCEPNALWEHDKFEYVAQMRVELEYWLKTPLLKAAERHRSRIFEKETNSRKAFGRAADSVCYRFLEAERLIREAERSIRKACWRVKNRASWPEIRR